MKKDTTRRAMDQVDDRLISRCNEVRTAAGAPVKTVRHPVFDFMKGAACFLLCGALVVGLMMLPKKKKDTVGYEGGADISTLPSRNMDSGVEGGEEAAVPVDEEPAGKKYDADSFPVIWGEGIDSFRVFRFGFFDEVPGGNTAYIRSYEELQGHYAASDTFPFFAAEYDAEYFAKGGSLILSEQYTASGSFVMQPGSAEITEDGVLHIGINEYVGEYGTGHTDDIGYYTAVVAVHQPVSDIEVFICEMQENASVLLRNATGGVLPAMHISSEPAGYNAAITDKAALDDFQELLQSFCLLPYDGVAGELDGCTFILKLPFGNRDFAMYDICGAALAFDGEPGEYTSIESRYTLSERDAGLLDAAIAALLRYGTGSGSDTDDPPSSTDEVTTAPDETVWDTKVPVDTSGDTTDPAETDVPTSVFGSIRFDLLHDGIRFDEDPCGVHIFRDYDVLKQYINDKVGEEAFYTRYASTGWYDKYFAPLEQTLKKGGTVVIIPLETPSGGDRLEPAGAVLKDGVLTVTLNHYRIGMTCDIGVWTAILSAGGEITDCQVQFNRLTEAPDEGAGGKVGVMQGKCIYDIQYPEGSDERNIEWSVTLSPDATVPDVTVRTEGDHICLNDDFRIGGPGNGCMSFYVGAPAGSGKTFLCFCMAFGSGICDARIIIIDPKTGETVFTLCDRMNHDYTLFLRNGTLCVAETEYPVIPFMTSGKEPIRTGTLCFTGTDIRVIWDDIVTLGD